MLTATIFVVGKSFSGKTSLCNALIEVGIHRVSVSSHLRDVYISTYRTAPNRSQLGAYGLELLRDGHLDLLHEPIIKEISKYRSASVDGLRFVDSFLQIRNACRNPFVVYLDCPADIRRLRAIGEIGIEEWETLNNSPTELTVEEFMPISDLTISYPTTVNAQTLIISNALERMS